MKLNKNLKTLIGASLAAVLLSGTVIAIAHANQNSEEVMATYTNGDAATYYSSIDDSQSGNTLLTALRSLNLDKRKSTVGYSSMGTTPTGQFKYTDYDPDSVQYDSNGQPYGTRISSFYTFTSATSWNREHVWPNSHGGGSGGDAGTPYPDADIHMPRPTISSENSSRGNSFFVEGMNHSSNGWDPYTAGYSENSRGEAARITFYCTLVNSKLILAPNNTTPSGTDSVTGQSFGSGHTMGNLETLIKWNINYPVSQREKNRNEGAEYLQGNRNAFVDHPEYACKIWGNVNSTIKNMCANASWDVGPSVSISKSTASMVVDDTTVISANASDSSQITWSTSDATVVGISSSSSNSGTNITLTAIGPGTATITARATIESTVYSATCTVTVSSSGSGGGGQEDADSYSIVPTDLSNGSYPTTATSYTAASGIGLTAYNTANFSSKIQFKKSGGYLYNNSSLNLGTLTLSGVSGSLTVYAGTTRNPSSTTVSGSNGVYDLTGYNYFKIINNSGSVATCSSITVGIAAEQKTLSSISVKTAPTKITYTAGEYFDPTGLVITRTYSDSTSDTYAYAGHTSEFTFSPTTSTALTTSNASVTITYGGKSCSQAITVNAAKTLSSISVSTAPTKTSYTSGENFDPTGLVIRRTYSDSTYDTYTYAGHTSEFSFSPSLSTYLTTSNVSVTITYGGKSCSQAITVTVPSKTLSSIAVSGQKTSFTIDDTFSFGGTVTATFSDSTQSDVTSSTTFSGYNMSVAGNYTVTASYTYGGTTKTAEYQITVSSSGGSGGGESGSFSNTYSYDDMSDWSVSNCTTPSGYILCPDSNNTYSVALIPGIFTNKTITSNVVITINSATYGSGSSPSSSSYAVYNSEACSSQVSATQSGTLPTSSTYTNVIYTVSLANALAGFTDDLAVKITKPGRQIRLKSITVEFDYETSSSTPVTSISASVSKTFYVGETISASDISVKDSNNQTVSSFTFANNGYRFTYADAASGGTATSKTFTNAISGSEHTCSLTVSVQRKAYASPSSTSLEHTGAEFSSGGIGGSPYAEGQTATVDGVTFSVDGYIYSSKLSLSDSKTSAKGKVVNTTPYPSAITNVTVSGASPDIQLSVDGSTWVNLSSATPSTVNYYYLKLYYSNTTQTNYVNINSITVSLKANESPANVANYIMYEDTDNQCVSKLNTAMLYLSNLSSSDRLTFRDSEDYVISTARERLEAWARNQGKTINYVSGTLVSSRVDALSILGNEGNVIAIIVITSISAISVIGVTLMIRKRKEK